MKVMTNPLHGCLTCGHIGWSRSAERVDGAGEEAGNVLVRKTAEMGHAEGDWVGDCGHLVPPDTALARCLDSLRPETVGPLAPNRPEMMGDWRPSSTL